MALPLPHGPPPHSTFAQFYADANSDELAGNYGTLMAEFRIGAGTRTPQELRTLATQEPRNASVGYLFQVESPGNPAYPGSLTVIHSTSVYCRVMGRVASQWDDQQFGTIGDVVAGQVPNVVHLPINSFQQLNGGNLYCVPLMGRVQAQFAVDPTTETLGPFAVHDVGVELIAF
jgi:hypothetical protein